MIEESLEEFMSKVDIKNKNIAIYKNEEKGLTYPLNLTHLLCRVDYLELEATENKDGVSALKSAIFQQLIDDKEYKIEDIEKVVPKNEITKRDSDKYTLTTKKTKGVRVWNVTNAAKIHTTFTSKEEAFKLCEEINNKVVGYLD